MILRGTAVRHDVGVLNGRDFMIVCGIGFDARVVERLAAVRRGHIGYRHYVGPLWHTFRHHEFPPLNVEADGQPLFEGRGMVFVGIQPRYSLGLRLLAINCRTKYRSWTAVVSCTASAGRCTLRPRTACPSTATAILRGPCPPGFMSARRRCGCSRHHKMRPHGAEKRSFRLNPGRIASNL